MEPNVINPDQNKDQVEKPTNIDIASPGVKTPEEPHTPDVPTMPVGGAEPKKSAKNKRNILLLVLVLLLALAGGVFAYLKINDLAKPATTTADTAPKDVAELRIGTTYTPFNKVYPDPNFLVAGSWATTTQLYEGLVGFANGNRIVPLLATSWTNPDKTTWLFTLKENVKFHDGRTLTAEDVKSSIDRAVADPNMIPLLVDSIESVSVVDDQHVQIKTKEPDAILLNKLLFLYVQGGEMVNGLIAGTGAYRVADGFDPAANEKEMRLVAFDDYHGGKPAVRSVTLLGYDDEAQMVTAVKEDKVDITDLFLGSPGEIEDIAGYSEVDQADGFIAYLGINTTDTKSPLSNLKVRQALRLAIDPQEFITNTDRQGVPASQITMRLNFGYNPDLEPIKRDVTKAKALLTEAGYPNGVTVSLSYGVSEATTAGFEEIKKQAAEAGITVKADTYGSFSELNAKIPGGDTQMYSLSSASAFIDSYDLFAYNFQNENFKNSTFDEILAKSNTEFDANERKKLLQQASKLIVDEVAAIPLVESVGVYYVKENLSYHQELGFALPGDYIRAISGK